MKPTRRDTFAPHTVYKAYDAEGVLIYVGCTSAPEARLGHHRLHSPWHPFAVRFEFEQYPNYFQGRGAESAAIRHDSPVFNIAGRDVLPAVAHNQRDAYVAANRGVALPQVRLTAP